MSHARTSSEAVKTPHSVSLKVLRLSRPLPSQQTPLPPTFTNSYPPISSAAALATHSTTLGDPAFIFSPLLTLPSSFGILHAGETFTCTLCVNNELPTPASHTSESDDGDTKEIPSITDVRITAEIQVPSSTTPVSLDLSSNSDRDVESRGSTTKTGGVTLKPGETLQHILRHHLSQEGNHVLAVTVTYTETRSLIATPLPGQASGLRASASSRVRTFRKLYQFAAQSLLGIRTKFRILPAPSALRSADYSNSTESRVGAGNRRVAGTTTHVLEAQLENHSDTTISLSSVSVVPRDGLTSQSLNAAIFPTSSETDDDSLPDGEKWNPLIAPGDVMQVAFLLHEVHAGNGRSESQEKKMRAEAQGLCQLSVAWKGSMGEEGELTTAWLGGKRR